MIPAAPQLFTAAEIARALAISKRAVLMALRVATPTSTKRRGGNAAKAWVFDALPAPLRARLSEMAKRQGCRDALHLLSTPAASWSPEVSFSEASACYQEQAMKLRDALSGIMPQQHCQPAAELQHRGLVEYRRVFGHEITPGRWWRLFNRTIERDGFRQDWMRVELYLDDAARKLPAPPVSADSNPHQPLVEIIASLEDKANPGDADRTWLLHHAFMHLESLEQGASARQRRQLKASLITWLGSAMPALSRNSASLRRLFNARLAQWQENGRSQAAIEDRRPVDSGRFRTPDFAADMLKIRDLAVLLNGNESLAHRRLRKQGALSQEFCDYYDFDLRRNKSLVPRSVRSAVTGEVEIALPLVRGPKQARLAAPHIQRNWDDATPGDVFTADDVTWNHYWWDVTAEGRIYITRGECLLFTDEMSDTPLSFSLHGLEDAEAALQLNPKRKASYNQVHIRRGMLKTHDEHGLPDLGWRFEGGTWQARLIRGDAVTGAKHLHWRDTETNCQGTIFNGADAGQIFHATTPRAKVIERTLLALQQEMRTDQAFVGFDERREKQERMQDIIGRIRNGSEHPGNLGIPSREDFIKKIHERLQEYMHEPKNGKRHRGASPWELWQERITRKPLRKIADEARWVFASHFKRVMIRNGRILIRGILYANEATVAWNQQEVEAFWNVECPEVLVFSNLKRTQFFSVKAHILPSRNPTAEQFRAARHDLGAHTRKAREIYQSVMHPLKSSVVRDSDHSETTKQIGRMVNAAVAEQRQQENEDGRMMTRIRQNAALLGRALPINIRNPQTFLEAQEREIRINGSRPEPETAAP